MERRALFCNVVVVPPQKIARSAVAASAALKKRGGLFVLDRRCHLPHITLYITVFPASNLKAVNSELRKTVKNMKPFLMQATAYEERGSGYVEIRFRRTKAIAGIQKRIIGALNPLREGLVPKINAKSLGHSSSEKRNIKLYGYANVFSDFRPHLTLTRLRRRKRNGQALTGLLTKDFSFLAKDIGLFLVGKHFTCRKILGRFKAA